MKFLCWLIDHKWAPTGAVNGICCTRCQARPYDDVTLPEWAFNEWRFGVGRALRNFGKRVRLYAVSRKCWTPGHAWAVTSDRCTRCGMTGIEDAERGEWMLPEWKKLWRAWLSDRAGILKLRPQDKVYAIYLFNWRLGVEYSVLYIQGQMYMKRWIAYFGPFCLRLHKFYSGDDDSAPHTHPWAFITFPFHSYVEWVYEKGVFKREQVVKQFRFHYRPPTHEHVVKGPMWQFGFRDIYYQGCPLYSTERGFEPFWTFVITTAKSNDWGFYPQPNKFVYWRDYKPGVRTGGVAA